MTMNPQLSAGICPRCGAPWTPGGAACARCGFMPSAVLGYQPVPAQPPTSLWPTVLITLFFNLFGLIPAALGADRDRSNGHGGTRQWMAFLITWLAETLAVLVLALIMPAMVLGWIGVHYHDDAASGSGAGATPTVSVATEPAGRTTTAAGAQSTTRPAETVTATSTVNITAPATNQVTATVSVIQVSVVNTCGASGTGDCYLSVRDAPSGSGKEMTRVDEGQTLDVVCQVHGGFVNSSIAGDSDVWSKVQGGGYVSNLYIEGPGISKDAATTVCS